MASFGLLFLEQLRSQNLGQSATGQQLRSNHLVFISLRRDPLSSGREIHSEMVRYVWNSNATLKHGSAEVGVCPALPLP